MRRRNFLNRQLHEVYQEITSSQNWTVPSGCTQLEAFVVGGGNNGGRGDELYSGAGGNGGECKTYTLYTTPGQTIYIQVGSIGQDSYILNTSYRARGGRGRSGGARLDTDGAGNPGQNGYLAFGNTNYSSRRYGASGGSGGAVRFVSPSIQYGGAGGNTGGGDGGKSQDDSTPGTSSGGYIGEAGDPATFYGAGGGGSGKTTQYYSDSEPGGSGYQGIVILHYYSY